MFFCAGVLGACPNKRIWLPNSKSNPLTYYDGRTFTWEAGRRLASTAKSGITTSYTYNDNGIRTSKTHNGVTTTYYLNGDSVVREQNPTDTIDYYYDEKGDLFGFNLNGSDFYYVRNGQNEYHKVCFAAFGYLTMLAFR